MMTATQTEEYLTIRETAAKIKVSPKGVRILMCEGILKVGVHFFRPTGLGPPFRLSALEAWIEGKQERQEAIPLKKGCVLRLPGAQRANGL
jgi:hypothetical protein